MSLNHLLERGGGRGRGRRERGGRGRKRRRRGSVGNGGRDRKGGREARERGGRKREVRGDIIPDRVVVRRLSAVTASSPRAASPRV